MLDEEITEHQAADLELALRALEYVWRHDSTARSRYAGIAMLWRPIIAAARRKPPEYVFLREPVPNEWAVGPRDAPMIIRDDEKRRGLAIAHFVIGKRGQLVPYDELAALGPGACTQKACGNALRTAENWMRGHCPAVAEAIARIVAGAQGLRYPPPKGAREIAT